MISVDFWGTIGKSDGKTKPFLISEIGRMLQLSDHNAKAFFEKMRSYNLTESEYHLSLEQRIDLTFAHFVNIEVLKADFHLLRRFKVNYQWLLHNKYNFDLVHDKVIDFINFLHNDWNEDVAIFSNSGNTSGTVLIHCLQNKGLINTIPFISSDKLMFKKPDPMFYTKALFLTRRAGDNQWVHIGDDMSLDIEPVTKLGGSTRRINPENPKASWEAIFKQWHFNA